MTTVRFEVSGRPVPQGSVVAHMKGGRASIHYAAGSGLAAWRNQVASAAREAWGETVYGGPFTIGLQFLMQRPKSHYADLRGTVKPRYRWEQPSVQPDLDKLVRAILDALTGVVWRDDGQVTQIVASKEYDTHTGVVVTLVVSEQASEYTGLEANG